MGQLEQEITVTGSVGEAGDGRAVLELEAAQGDQKIIRNGQAEISTS